MPLHLDDIDRQIVAALVDNGRLPNNVLAERLGIAASTCLARTRALVDRGVIRGFHADVNYPRLGDLQAVISLLKGSDLDVALQFVNYR